MRKQTIKQSNKNKQNQTDQQKLQQSKRKRKTRKEKTRNTKTKHQILSTHSKCTPFLHTHTHKKKTKSQNNTTQHNTTPSKTKEKTSIHSIKDEQNCIHSKFPRLPQSPYSAHSPTGVSPSLSPSPDLKLTARVMMLQMNWMP
jgi:hypothetical protein